MKKVSSDDLRLFLSIAEHLSLSRAAAELGLSPSALSHALRSLEERLDLRLFNRTTRSVALTEAGQRLRSRIQPAFRDIDDALEDLNSFRGTPSGTLRINAGRPAVQMVLLPLLARFLAAYPDIRVEVSADNALVNVVSGGFDAGVRFGETLEADMVAVPIGPRMRSAVVATPEFFDTHGIPQHPQDVRQLPCIRLRFPSGTHYRWEFERGGVALETEVEGPLALDDMGLIAEAALGGRGLAYVFEDLVSDALNDGRLQRVLEDWCPYYGGFYLYYPSRRQLPAALRAFVDFTRDT